MTSKTPRLLAAPAGADSLADFKQYTMAHPKLKEMHEKLIRAIREPGGASLLFILGPTGVGKTTLISRLAQQIVSDLQPQLEQDRERMAVAGMEAEAPTHGNYDFKQHFKRALEALGEILINHKIDMSQRVIEANRQGCLIVDVKGSAAALRGSLEESLRRRRPAAFFIDEAHHLGKVSGGRKFQDHLDVIKSLANLTKITHVLVGTYELFLLLNLSDQLSRRSLTFHFDRYRAGRPSDVKTFQNIIWNFQQRLPFPRQQDLRLHGEYLMERSLGCIGILKGWFLRAADAALEARDKTLALEHLKQHEPSDAEWRSIATVMLEGEESLRESEAELNSLRVRLREDTLTARADKNESQEDHAQLTAGTAMGKRQARRRPGERHPRREPVGSRVNQ